jgi:hypothetical protein
MTPSGSKRSSFDSFRFPGTVICNMRRAVKQFFDWTNNWRLELQEIEPITGRCPYRAARHHGLEADQ